MRYVIEVQRREGNWHRCESTSVSTAELFRYAAALGRWIGEPSGNIAAVRVLPFPLTSIPDPNKTTHG